MSSAARRPFSSSAVARFPRKPSPKTTPFAPTPAQLAAPPAPPQTFSQPAYKRSIPFHIRQRQPTNPRRYITDVDTALPLPTTFPAGVSSRADLARPQIPAEKLPVTESNPFPYKYYEISLRRSLNGLSATTKKHASALGLTSRHQVVWRLVSPRAAGQILTLRELVAVRLVNEIPPKPVLPTGFAKVGNAVGSTV
ncbi:hypothetical protein HDU86_003202 [Geranomyces michiganensis]|nr:hypothetical protein HDU86_003202 [Geranomyces michiganensis]